MKTPVLCGFFVLAVVAAMVLLDPPRPKKSHPAPRVVNVPRRRIAVSPRKGQPAPVRQATDDEKKKEDALLDEAATVTNEDEERAQALAALEAAILEQEQVDRLAQIAESRDLSLEVKRAALETLIAVAAEGHEIARLRALEIFARVRADLYEERSLAEILADPSPEVRTRVATALGGVEPEGQDMALDSLERAFTAEQDPTVQEAMADAMVRAGGEKALPVIDRLSAGAPEATAQILARHRASVAPPPPPPPPAPPTAPPEGE